MLPGRTSEVAGGRCNKSPDGKHCMHGAWAEAERCCWCGRTARRHGPYVDADRKPRLSVDVGPDWDAAERVFAGLLEP